MDYYCETCDKHICNKNKSKHFKSECHLEISNCYHVILSLNNVDFDKIDEIYNLYLIEHDIKYDFFKVKILFKLVFDSNCLFENINIKLKANGAIFCFKQFMEVVIGVFRIEGHLFDYVEEMNIIAVVDKRDRTYQFCMKHNLCAL